ncbi:hypothetical protein NOVO_06340 [Rickettsiales bacterium Ac37b]|nr:hypothetical protein NOVO_06340 [Rickettsiales bacterium Ac37b]
MQHIAGVCLCDASTTATGEELAEYLTKYHYNGVKYHIEMIQTIISIGELNDYSKSKAINLAQYDL